MGVRIKAPTRKPRCERPRLGGAEQPCCKRYLGFSTDNKVRKGVDGAPRSRVGHCGGPSSRPARRARWGGHQGASPTLPGARLRALPLRCPAGRRRSGRPGLPRHRAHGSRAAPAAAAISLRTHPQGAPVSCQGRAPALETLGPQRLSRPRRPRSHGAKGSPINWPGASISSETLARDRQGPRARALGGLAHDPTTVADAAPRAVAPPWPSVAPSATGQRRGPPARSSGPVRRAQRAYPRLGAGARHAERVRDAVPRVRGGPQGF
jgi:hypothetical protein